MLKHLSLAAELVGAAPVPRLSAAPPAERQLELVRQRKVVADAMRLMLGCEPKHDHDSGESGGGLFLHKRECPGGDLYVAKIQTMRNGANYHHMEAAKKKGFDGDGGVKDDDRITPVGRILRSLKVDELPQLLQYLSGLVTGRRKLALFGIRPKPREIWRAQLGGGEHDHIISSYTSIRPGVFGLQYALPWGSTSEERFRLYDEYAANCRKHGQIRANLRYGPRIVKGLIGRVYHRLVGRNTRKSSN